LKERYREGQKWREDEDEDVSSYLMTLKEKRGYWKLKEEALVALCGKLALEESVDLSYDRRQNE
jgi:hypothetical protein